jgi:uncharacterized protein (DUF342 family)
MILCKVSELKHGMIVAQDVIVSGVAIPVLRRGVVLNEQYIESIKKYGIGFLYVEPAEGYKGAKGEVLSLTEIRSDIIFEGKVEIKGNIPSNISIDAGEGVIIEGNIADGCRIFSRSGAIVIKGFVLGTGDNSTRLEANQNIKVGSVTHAGIKTDGELVSDGDIIDTVINAKSEVKIGGRVIRSQINTALRAALGECGDKDTHPVVVAVNPMEAQEVMQNALKIDAQIAELSKEKTQLQNIIDLIKKLGGNVEQLPQDKKLELAKGAKRFTDISGQIQVLTAQKNDMIENLKQILAVRRVIVNREIYPNVKIQIGGKAFVTTKAEQRVAFCVEDGKVAMKIL